MKIVTLLQFLQEACNSITQVLSYSFEQGYNMPNNIKIQISNGQYVNLPQLAIVFMTWWRNTVFFI